MSDIQTYEDARQRMHARYTFIEPTKADMQLWIICRSALLHAARFFGVILYERCVVKWTRDCDTLATDGVVILINPDYFRGLTLLQRMFAVCHEIMHIVLAHCELGWLNQRQGYIVIEHSATVLQEGMPAGTLPFIHTLMNVAEDFVINALLVEGKIGQRLPDWLYNPDITGDTSSVKVYRDLWQRVPPKRKQQAVEDAQRGGQGGQDGSGGDSGDTKPAKGLPAGMQLPSNTQGSKQLDDHLEPGSLQGKSPGQAAAEREDRRESWTQTVKKAATAARQAGQMTAGFARFVDKIVEPEVSWRDHLPATIARSMGGGGYDWRKAERRYINRPYGQRIFMPTPSGHGCGTFVIVGDTSGSINDPELALIHGAIKGILEDARPQKIWMLWCDMKIHRIDEIESVDDLGRVMQLGAPGGGGTSFREPFKWVEDEGLRPDALIYITDMYGAFPDAAPLYPTIWCSISEVLKAPFGEVIEIPR